MRKLSMKKPVLNMKKGAVPTYEEVEAAVAAGQYTPEEGAQMIAYFNLAPMVAQPTVAPTFPEDKDFQASMTGVTDFTAPPGPGLGAPGRPFLGKNKKKKK